MLKITANENAVFLPVKVVPGASKSAYLGEWDGRARLAVAAPPEKGQANRQVAELIARMVGVRRREVSVVAGDTSPLKTIRIDGATLGAVQSAFAVRRS